MTLRYTAALLWLGCFLAGQGAQAEEAASTDKAVEAVFDRFVAAWNAEDPRALGSVWSENGQFVSARGPALVGRARIERAFTRGLAAVKSKPVGSVPFEPMPGYHTRLMTSMFACHLLSEGIRIRTSHADVAVATGTWHVVGSLAGPEGLMFGTDTSQEGGFEATVVKTSTGWLLSRLRFTPKNRPASAPAH